MNSYNGFTPEQRNKAQAWLNAQWRSGALKRPSECCACGQTKGVIDAHCEDYSEPFAAGKTDAYPLCFRCHMMVHCRFRNSAAWDRYCDAIAAGKRFRPFFTRDFQTFVTQTLEGDPPLDVQTEPRKDLLREMIHADRLASPPA